MQMATLDTRTSCNVRPSSPSSASISASGSASHNPPDDHETYRMMVLRFDKSEEEVDRDFLNKALELGIHIPQDPRITLNLINTGISNFDFGTAPVAVSEPSADSRASQSIHAPSDSSIESKGNQKTPSLAATSVTSAPSTNSGTSHKSNYVKLKRGLRRFSTMRGKKRNLGLQPSAPDLPIRPLTTDHLRPELQARSNTADQILSIPTPGHHSLTTPASPVSLVSPTRRGASRRKVISMPYGVPPPPLPSDLQPLRSPPPPPLPSPVRQRSTLSEHAPSTLPQPLTESSAFYRSLKNPTLKKLRTAQLQEQLRFISFRASQTRLLRTAHLARKRAALSTYKALQSDTETRHADALASLEHRHLSAEVDLHKTLKTERQACDVRLKHMQAYCNTRESVVGMPVRNVTEADFKKLEQQFHVRNGMDNLHASRINVLREKQAKQMERVIDKQEKELMKQTEEFEREESELEDSARVEERDMERVFAERKARLVARWRIAEAIERKLLEVDMGESVAELPAMGWGRMVEVGKKWT